MSNNFYGNGLYIINATKQTDGNAGSTPLSTLFDNNYVNKISHQDSEITLTFNFPELIMLKDLFIQNNDSCRACEIFISDDGAEWGSPIFRGQITISIDFLTTVNLVNNTEYTRFVKVRLFEGINPNIEISEIYQCSFICR